MLSPEKRMAMAMAMAKDLTSEGPSIFITVRHERLIEKSRLVNQNAKVLWGIYQVTEFAIYCILNSKSRRIQRRENLQGTLLPPPPQ